MTRRLSFTAAVLLGLVLLAFGAGEALVQRREDEVVRAATRAALAGAAGQDFGSKVVALRDYVRARVRNVDFSARGRPFLRHTAAETLRTGKGRCGEATRVFVNMARAAGIPAQRLYLEGREPHVAAAVAADAGTLVVDPANRFFIPEITTLEGLGRYREFKTYSTFGFRRLGPLRALPSNFVGLGPLAYLLENPHAIMACLYFFASALAFALAALLARRLPRPLRLSSQEGFTAAAELGGRASGAGV